MTDAHIGLRANQVSGARQSSSSPWGTLVAAWRRHKDLLSNAGSLLATTGVTSALGFTFWTFAAREFSQQAVGYGSATVSAITLLGTIGVFGLGTVLIGELPRSSPRAGLVSAALLASGIGSLLLGLGFVLVAPLISHRFVDILSQPVEAVTFIAGVVLTAVTWQYSTRRPSACCAAECNCHATFSSRFSRCWRCLSPHSCCTISSALAFPCPG